MILKMPRRCIVYGSASASALKGVSVHIITFFDDKRPIAVKRRKRWIDFVERLRKKWAATKTSVICSRHFHPNDFEQYLASSDTLLNFQGSFLRTLRRDDHRISSFPSIYPVESTEGPAS